MKMKTLKDLKIEPEANKCDIGWNNALRISRQEAIDWVKEKRIKLHWTSSRGYIIGPEEDNSELYRNIEIVGAIKEKIRFYNITEEEIK